MKAVAFCYWGGMVYEGLKYCMYYYDCKRCPLNARCEEEYNERIKTEDKPKREKIVIKYEPK